MGLSGLMELVNHIRHHGNELVKTLFWIEFEIYSFVPWTAFFVLLVAGLVGSRFFYEEVVEAWGEASFVEGQRK